ncbi:MAG: helix-turn-helix transcriptional regulator [Hyphomicrobiales bacterium]|nr:helix-turn-helix transcriptional regulator [Hyphomicrobiales bacterium]
MTDFLKKRLQQRLTDLDLTPEGASKKAGLSRDFLRQLFSRTAGNPRADNLVRLAEALETTPAWLLGGDDKDKVALPAPNARIGEAVEFPDKKIPVYGQAVGGVNGEFEMNGHFIQEVICPPALSQVSDAYAVFVSGDSMEPRYFDGELLYVHPHRRPRRGDFVVAQIQLGENGPRMAFIKRFERWNSEELIIEQYNPVTELKFSTSQVVSVHVVVGTGEG